MSQETKKVWVSDVIGDTYKEWKPGDFVCIDAGTGTGKSHFVRNELYDACNAGQRILFISNRNKLKEQIRHAIKGKEDTITIINYQAIESKMIRGEKLDFDMFDYVVCDECHYFLTDASYNKNNDLSLSAVLEIKNSVVMFMTATGKSFFKFINDEYKAKRKIHTYRIPRDYSRIKQLFFFEEDDSLEQFIAKEVKDNEKVLYFCNNVKKLYELSRKYNDSLFIFSDPFEEGKNGNYVKKKTAKAGNNDKYAKYLDREAIQEVIETKALNRKFTFTTTTLDNGVDLYGKDLKWIVIDDIRDFDTMIQ
ncbi:DEAD/DEAH box helicase family protein, partial [Paenibacillus sp. NPDC093718]|uniref:DEAD/DEAH box helicase family protein n=1 Tax=Paenibacillus sp. NPDC093718 TaxID=3390601 RepID=UPI003D00F799